MICDYLDDKDKVKQKITEQKFDVIITSYGGSWSNAIEGRLRRSGFNIRYGKTKEEKSVCLWRNILCHSPYYIDLGKPYIYIYDNDIIKAFLSVKRRGGNYWAVNQRKLNNKKKLKLSDENLLKSMIQQFYNFTEIKRNDVLIIKSSELFQPEIKEKINNFLGRKVNGFPIEYREPTINTSTHYYSQQEIELFDKYKKDIEYIKNFEN